MKCILGTKNGNGRLSIYQTNAFTKSGAGRKRVQDVDCTLEGLHDLSVFSSEFVELPRMFLKNGGYRVHRVAIFELLGEGMFI